jgi:N-acetylneuraminic acid mutarotase
MKKITLITLALTMIFISTSKSHGFSWNPVKFTGDSPEERFMHAMFFDQKTGQIYFTGGMQYPFSPMMSDVWSFDPKTNKWTKLVSTGYIPPKYSVRDYTFIPSERSIYAWADNGEENLHKMFIFNIDKKEWSKITPVGEFPKTAGHRVMCYDPMNNRLLLFGGYYWTPEASDVLNDLYAFDLKKKEWSKLKTEGITAPKLKAAEGYTDQANGRMIIYGGLMPEEKPNAEIYTFSFSKNSWGKIDAQGDKPIGGDSFYGILDAENNRLIEIGSTENKDSPSNGLYIFDLKSNKWLKQESKDINIKKFNDCGPVYCSTNKRIYVYGGMLQVPLKTMFYLDISSGKK